MSDRTAAYIFADVFKMLADINDTEPVSFDVKAKAREFWLKSFDYDFHPSQMDADPELVKLGLARMVDNPDDDGQIAQYKAQNGVDWDED